MKYKFSGAATKITGSSLVTPRSIDLDQVKMDLDG
jgi:hypothetical protein